LQERCAYHEAGHATAAAGVRHPDHRCQHRRRHAALASRALSGGSQLGAGMHGHALPWPDPKRKKSFAAPAAKAYTAYAPDALDAPPDEAIDPTPAQRAAVRRTLSKLQKRGLVMKLGHVSRRTLLLRRPRARAGYRSQRRAALRIAIAAALSTASARTVCRRDCGRGMKLFRSRSPAYPVTRQKTICR
jgi:hypothetical protein